MLGIISINFTFFSLFYIISIKNLITSTYVGETNVTPI